LKQQSLSFFLLFCLTLTGCSSTIDYQGENKFQPRIEAFAHAIRWSEFERAQVFIRMRNNQESYQNQDTLKQIKVTKYEFLSEMPQENFEQQTMDIISTYSIDYYHTDNFKIKHQQYVQHWWYDDTAGTWFLDSNLPDFKH